MKNIILVFVLAFSFSSYAADKVDVPVKVGVSNAAVAVKVDAIPAAPAVPLNVVKDPVLVPPQWLQDLVVSAEGFPTIGPIVVKVIQWGALLITILTAVCGCVVVICKSLSGIASLANLAKLGSAVEAFENSKVLYYLKFLSAFNAQKPVPAEEKKAA